MGRPPLPPPGTRAPGGGPSAARPPGPAGHRAVFMGPVLRCCPPRGPGGPCSSPSLGPNRTCFHQNAPVLSPVPGFDGTRD